MKKSYKMKDVDCAHCAAEMTEGIKKIPGVIDANVTFLMQKLSLEVEEEGQLDDILQKVIKTCKKVDPECEVLL